MANKIKLWDIEDGETQDDMLARVLFFYDLDPVITTATGLLVVPTPASIVPDEINALGLVTQQEKDAMDAGTLLVKLPQPIKAKRGEGFAKVGQRAEKAYLDNREEILRELRQRYRFTGRSRNVTVPE